MRYPGRPFIMNGSPWQLRRTAPLLGQHTVEVLRELGFSDTEIGGFRNAGAILDRAEGD